MPGYLRSGRRGLRVLALREFLIKNEYLPVLLLHYLWESESHKGGRLATVYQ